MKRFSKMGLALAAAAAAAVLGCGDDDETKTCGPGTNDMDEDGVCTPNETGPTVTCTGGTMLNDDGTECVPSADVCADGTVLVADECVDIATTLTINVEETAEPNGLTIGGEDSAEGAGVIALPAIDATIVVHGHITPFQDADGNDEIDPDFDTFTINAGGPTLLDISADGVGGLAAAFIVQAPDPSDVDDPLAAYLRYGMSVTSDTARRFIYLPAAGDYVLAIADVRSLYTGGDPPPAAGIGGAAGGPDAEYYVSITAKAIPAGEPLDVSGGGTTATGTFLPGDAPRFYSLPMGAGINSATADIGGTPTASISLSEGVDLRAFSQEFQSIFGSSPASFSVFGGTTGTVVVDYTYHYNPDTLPYSLVVTAGGAAPLSTSGGTATQPEDPDGEFSVFYYDVASPDDIIGIDLSFNQPVVGVVVDEDFFIAALFTYDLGEGTFIDTFSDYEGLIRHRGAGRYYFLTGDPDGVGPTDIIATSTLATVPTGTIVKGTPLTAQSAGTFAAAPYNYAAGVATDPWQLFNATGAGTGAITASFFDPATAYGTLVPVQSDLGLAPVDDAPLFSKSFPQGGAPQGRVLLADGTDRYLVTVETATTTGTPTFTLDFEARAFTDLGTLAAAATVSRDGQSLTAAAPEQFYLVRSGTNTVNTLAVDPGATLNTEATFFDADENALAVFDTALVGGVDTGELPNFLGSFVAFSVGSSLPVVGTQTFDLDVTSGTFTPGTYTRSAGSTTFTNVCPTGSPVVLEDDGGGLGGADDGLSASRLAPPTNFEFFGVPATGFLVSSNGWMSISNAPDSVYSNPDMPSATVPNGVIAPAWDDYRLTSVCTRTVGSRMTVQWDGTAYAGAAAIHMQAILDASNDTIELVYASTHTAVGATSTVGLENQLGTGASKAGFNTSGTTAAGTSILFTPN